MDELDVYIVFVEDAAGEAHLELVPHRKWKGRVFQLGQGMRVARRGIKDVPKARRNSVLQLKVPVLLRLEVEITQVIFGAQPGGRGLLVKLEAVRSPVANVDILRRLFQRYRLLSHRERIVHDVDLQ